MDLTRRLAVRGGALGIALALAGCIAPGTGDGGLSFELHQIGPTTAAPDWSGRGNAAGAVEFYRTRADARERLDGELLSGLPGERREAALEFVDGTDFGTAVVLYVASEGPDTCHDEMAVRDLSLDGTTLTGTVAARDTRQSGEGCGDAITYPSALVRANADPRPDRAELTVLNGWGDESTVEATETG